MSLQHGGRSQRACPDARDGPRSERTAPRTRSSWSNCGTRSQQRRDADARNRLIEHHLPLARTIAATLFARRGAMVVEFMDYMQLATVGLIESIDRFDPQRGVAFEAFASRRGSAVRC